MDTNQAQFKDFLALSVLLTGFTEFQLYGTGQAKMYFASISDIVGPAVVDELMGAFHQVKACSEEDSQEVDHLLRGFILGDEKLGPIARNIIKLWYVGIWYQLPQNWRQRYGTMANDVTFVVSPIAYTEGLLWPAIGAHPPGAKAPGYGTWFAPPEIPEV